MSVRQCGKHGLLSSRSCSIPTCRIPEPLQSTHIEVPDRASIVEVGAQHQAPFSGHPLRRTAAPLWLDSTLKDLREGVDVRAKKKIANDAPPESNLGKSVSLPRQGAP